LAQLLKSKICTHCKIDKPITEYYRSEKGATIDIIYKSRCKACDNAKGLEKFHNLTPEQKRQRSSRITPQYRKNSALKTKYGITLEEYEIRYKEQNGKCAICQSVHDVLHVDHDHKTKIVRKLLCRKCNTMLGLADDDPERLIEAINYLRNFYGR
jgi:hypothetical protein